ncbi:TetR/AcrR family transcriptional regulator [Marinibactrum halimedae]|uniref:TetR/AcrR family transcriptional regulator n=1 Tax=Marinibactrum halimedae TaxID=1444977 RepID=UPI001E2DBCD1|nr:TetR/AcrR family transcriptional regulator [Marinibactrum halimedae]MCD9459391.1 TetR/AcrR family transcriptional regulator [Marinibactrum halimedae]
MATKERKKTLSEIKREAIIDAAKSVFLELGVERAHMNRIAEVAQVSKRTVYKHFESKESLLMQLLGQLWTVGMTKLEVSYDPSASLKLQLESLIKEEVEALSSEEYIGLARIAMEHFLFQPGIIQSELENVDPKKTALYRWMKAATDDGRLDISDLDYTFSQLQSLLKGSCFWPQMAKVTPILDEEQKMKLIQESAKLFLARYVVGVA